VRGFALLGIVLANMISYSLYLYLPDAARAALTTAPTDRVLDFLELAFVESKFYTIFSVLFGVGFAILFARTRPDSLAFHWFFLRRMGWLFLIGLVHAVFFWHNDILAAYAVCGVLLLPMMRARDRTVLAGSMLALCAPAILKALGEIPRGAIAAVGMTLQERFGLAGISRVEIWSEGTLAEIVLTNASAWFGQVDYVIASGMIFRIYGCFLLGLWIGRRDLHAAVHRHAAIITRIAVLGIAVGVPLNLVYAATFDSGSWLAMIVATLGILPLSAGYACALIRLWTRTEHGRLVKAFAAVGRMALTNYVGQSALCMLIFRGVGLGLGGHVGPTLYLPIGLGVYLLQLPISRAWLTRFQFGPLEWLWRMLTYGRWIPLARPAIERFGASA